MAGCEEDDLFEIVSYDTESHPTGSLIILWDEINILLNNGFRQASY